MVIRRGIVFAISMSWFVPAWVLAQERPDWGMHPMWWMGGAWGIGMNLYDVSLGFW